MKAPENYTWGMKTSELGHVRLTHAKSRYSRTKRGKMANGVRRPDGKPVAGACGSYVVAGHVGSKAANMPHMKAVHEDFRKTTKVFVDSTKIVV